MAPAKFDSSLQLPFAFKLFPILGLLFLAACFAVQAFMPHEKTDYVEWKSPQQALELSKKSGHPILYDFTAEWCGPCHALSDEIFRDKELAKWLNDSFVPVRVVDLIREESQNPPEVLKLQAKYHVEGFPTVIITNLKLIEYEKQIGYPGKLEMKKFLEESLVKMAKETSPYFVKYLKLDDAIVASRAAKKPLLIVFWDERGANARFDYLANSELVQLMKTKFVATEVMKTTFKDETKTPAGKELLAKLGLHQTPAIVIVPVDDSMPHFQIGASTAADNRDFLEKYLRLSSNTGAK